MRASLSAAVQTLRSELRKGFEAAEESDLYEWYDADDKLDICECIREFLPPKSWALAQKSKWVALQYVIMYAARDTDLSLDGPQWQVGAGNRTTAVVRLRNGYADHS